MSTSIRNEDIAVIGFSGRFPGAEDVAGFWKNCCDNRETIQHFTDEILDSAGIPREIYQQTSYVKAKGIVDSVALFDADFFGISELEASIMDPQQRLFLMAAWEALEHAGYAPKYNTPNRIGVFASTGLSHYLLHNILTNPDLVNQLDDFQLLIANDKDFLATRISYLFNLQGPSLMLQTGCSSSLVCIHYAVQSLLNGESEMALAGGVSLTIPQEQGYLYRKGMIGSPDGHCYAFDSRAEGTVKSNGLGIVVLKPLAQAIEDKDTIYAVIKGSAVNNDGAKKVAYTAPNVSQQAAVIKEALYFSEVDPKEIAYIETHGTGTLLGDPIEIAALKEAYTKVGSTQSTCALASLKTNIGHLDVAAGVAGFIKACLAVYYGKIPASLHFTTLNPKIDLDNTPFYINATLHDWPIDKKCRYAAVSAFGVGGTNAHVVIQQPPQLGKTRNTENKYWIFPFSAKSSQSLHNYLQKMVIFLTDNPHLALEDVAYTLIHGRNTFTHRKYVIANSHAMLLSKINCLQTQAIIEDDSDLTIIAQQWQRGENHLSQTVGKRIALPTYSWNLQRYWIDAISKKITNKTINAVADLNLNLKNAWQIALGVEPCGEDNFFRQGGTSLSAIHFIEQLPEHLRNRLSIVDLYEYPTFNQLTQFLNSDSKTAVLSKEASAEDLLFVEGGL